MDQARPLLGPATSRCCADPDGPAALFIVSMRSIVDHRRDAAIGEARRWVGAADSDYRPCALRWRPPSSEGIVTAEHRASLAVPSKPASRNCGEDDRGVCCSAAMSPPWHGLIRRTRASRSFQLVRVKGGIGGRVGAYQQHWNEGSHATAAAGPARRAMTSRRADQRAARAVQPAATSGTMAPAR